MTQMELIESRHSVRQYKDVKIEEEKRAVLNALADDINKQADLNVQIIYGENHT